MWARYTMLLLTFLICSSLFAQDELNPYYLKDNRSYNWGAYASLKFNFVSHDFSAFQNEFGVYNTDLMNVNTGLLEFEFGASLNRWVSAINFGISTLKDDYQDSLSLEFSTAQYELNIGYIVLKSNRIALTPKAAFVWRRNKLTNSDLDRKISMETYLQNRDLDVRINQIYGVLGLDFCYKMYRYNIFFSKYWSVGCFAGYRFKLTQTPWVYSRQNRILNDDEIDFSKLNVSFNVAFHF